MRCCQRSVSAAAATASNLYVSVRCHIPSGAAATSPRQQSLLPGVAAALLIPPADLSLGLSYDEGTRRASISGFCADGLCVASAAHTNVATGSTRVTIDVFDAHSAIAVYSGLATARCVSLPLPVGAVAALCVDVEAGRVRLYDLGACATLPRLALRVAHGGHLYIATPRLRCTEQLALDVGALSQLSFESADAPATSRTTRVCAEPLASIAGSGLVTTETLDTSLVQRGAAVCLLAVNKHRPLPGGSTAVFSVLAPPPPPLDDDDPMASSPPTSARNSDDGPRCALCFANSPTHWLMPCAHNVVCDECVALYGAASLVERLHRRCPLCRAPALYLKSPAPTPTSQQQQRRRRSATMEECVRALLMTATPTAVAN